jgi:hypothetical protein
MTAAEAKERLLHSKTNDAEQREYDIVVLHALDKQIPKKPKHVRGYGKHSTTIGTCPTCGGGNNSEYPYCGECGQALAWEAEE